MGLETEIRDLAVAIVTDDDNPDNVELRGRVEHPLIEANLAFGSFDDDAYITAVGVLKDLLTDD
jgi:hypothetical protein